MSEQDKAVPADHIVPVDRQLLSAWRQSWEQVLAAYETLPCESDDDAEAWTKFRNHVHEQLKAKEEERKTATAPLDREKRAIDSWYREARAPAEAFKKLANSKLEAYALAQEQERIKQLQAAQQFAAAQDVDAAHAALSAAPAETKTAGNSVRMSWTWEVEDLDAVPGTYLTRVVNSDAVQEYLERIADGHYPHVPGLKFTRAASARPTGKRK